MHGPSNKGSRPGAEIMIANGSNRDRRRKRLIPMVLVAAGLMMGLDILWLGLVGRPLYVSELGDLMAAEVNHIAAALFYVFYVTVIILYAVLPSETLRGAAGRGAQLGFVAYTTYELTNWAVIEGWGAWIVPVDILWGVILTATVSAGSYAASARR